MFINKGVITTLVFLLALAPLAVGAQQPFLMPVQGTVSGAAGGMVAPAASEVAAEIDLIVEANTYVPYFYPGRREPIPGSTVRLTALVLSGAVPASFRWQVGNQHLASTDRSAVFALPSIGGDVRVEVTALDQAGRPIGSAAEYIRPSSPQVLFYESNDLRGVSRVAAGESLVLIGDEMSVRAEPYFFGTNALLMRAFGNWSAERVDVITNDTDWRLASFMRRADTAASEAEVRLNVRSRDNLSETITGRFKLSL